MIIQSIKIKKALAFFFLFLLTAEMLLPLHSLALTSGPAQPEHKQFAPYGTNDMVDLFSGAFKYNIPLLDVDGYPVNLNYASGVGIDDEASWVGLGWNLNVGAVNRQLRGVPDDFAGDTIATTHFTADKITYGGRGTVRLELKGGDVAKVSGSISIGVFSDSYTGMGAEFGVNAGLSLGAVNSGCLTGGLNVGVNSNTSSGVSVFGGLSMNANIAGNPTSVSGVSANLSYNTREGFKELALSGSFLPGELAPQPGVTYSYNTPPFSPRIGFGYKSSNQSYSITIGGHAFAVFGGGGLTGYMNKQSLITNKLMTPEYGYLYADRGTKDNRAVMDFLREKDNPIIPGLPNLAVPVNTPDVFSYTNQAGSGQFRLQRGNTGVVFDPKAEDQSGNFSLGADYGFGLWFHGGIAIYDQNVTNVTRKWTKDNPFLPVADYYADPAKIMEEQTYFKMMGEQTAEDGGYVNSVQGEKMIAVSLDGRKTQKKIHDKYGNEYLQAGGFKKNDRQLRNSPVSYLTAGEAMLTSGNNSYKSYKLYDTTLSTPPPCGPEVVNTFFRSDVTRKKHHISEITVTENDGKRAVYGLPVYNLQQDEFTFAVNPTYKNNATDVAKNLIGMDVDSDGEIVHDFGRDRYYKHEKQPPYASSYLLTAILSPDYVDVTNNGITDDDLGTAVKFNYSKVPGNYGWRAPLDAGKALYNRGLNADAEDDKGSVIYGRKELWYLSSIETKTKIAYFLTADRDDALGVSDVYGHRDNTVKQRKLKEIRLYSKSDLTRPIKTVHLDYINTLCPGVPNNSLGGGKNTLKSVYFTYASSTKGRNHPYEFEYDYNQAYGYLSTDRWGVFKGTGLNPGAMRNDEFPYTIQNQTTANNNARLWNLSRIKLPTGGKIEVEYESGDYAYVQDRKAMQMVDIKAFITDSAGNATSNLRAAHGIKIPTPGPLRGVNDAAILQNFVNDYLNGRNDFYTRINVNVTDAPGAAGDASFDNVSCYGEIVKVKNNGDGTTNVIFKDLTEGRVTANPFIMAAWQKMRLEYPKYAYPGFEDRIQNETGIERALTAIVNAIGNLAELKKNFNERARDNDFATKVNLGKSFARVVKADGIKLGGPARVKKIRMFDGWDVMSGSTAPAAAYGQQYEYRTTNASGQTISSGVASYEPSIGPDENPMRMPVPYSQESKGTLTNYFYLEEPFGESLFPAPQIGYSNVIIRDLDAAGNADPQKNTGWIQQEFYTAKDYPVITEVQARPDVEKRGPAGWANFAGGNQVYELAMSQGYVIWLNDMHGKPKAERVFNQNGSEISSSVYYYKSDLLDAGKQKLNNTVATVDEKGTINPAEVIGREIELVADMREQETSDMGVSIQLGVDVVPFIWGALPIPHWPRKDNDSYRLFRSASVLKTVQQTGILEKVVKTVNGSTITSSNLVFDRNTGQPVVTSTNNEFDDPVYSVNMPAYWSYGKMAGAYKNVNTIFKNLTTDVNGLVGSTYASYLTGGDELIDLVANGKRYWVISSPTSSDPVNRIRLIDDAGNLVRSLNRDVKVYRSGYRNQLGATAGAVVSLKNPLAGGKLAVLSNADNTSYRVIDAKAILYEEEWGAKMCISCPPGYTISADSTKCQLMSVLNPNDTLNVVGIFDADYGMDGVIFKKSDNTTVTKKSAFWGGACPDGGGSFLMAANSDSIQDTTMSDDLRSKADTSSHAKTSAALTVARCGRLYSSGVWLNKSQTVTDIWMGLETCFTAAGSGTYAVGYGADNQMRLYIDDVLKVITPNISGGDAVNYRSWTVVALPLTAGSHKIRIEFYNFPAATAGNAGSVGVEIYNATVDALSAMTDAQAGAVTKFFSTETLPNNPQVNTYILDASGNRRISRYSCIQDLCTYPFICDTRPLAGTVNPYLAGILGNWRVSEEKTYEVNRTDQQIFANKGGGLNLRNSGYYNTFKSFWYYDIPTGKWGPVPANTNWVTSRYVTLYDQYGQEIENKDALLRYSSAAFGYRGVVPVAVAGNAMKREVFYDGFEDYKYSGLCGAGSCSLDSFDIRAALGTSSLTNLKSDDAHSGNYSLKLTNTITLKAIVHAQEHKPGNSNYLNKDAFGQYIIKLTKGLYPQGFQPLPSKKYVFSAWVKDGSTGLTMPAFNPSVNGAAIALTVKAAVEGWKLVEGKFDVLSGATSIQVILPASASAAVDDIRIFPYDATIKTYAYDEKTLRLMAEMDENNFATFYEYDDEGTLIRVKKETDRGIMTLKESRSVFRKKVN
ncbi:hypothetical protein QFZ51_003376 [Chitinophaga sp. W3I9]|uniref:hypothetical protein n=1 Tax=unclassified Chitinophaga TaxID=2619133 RepID=UPI003D1E81FB